MLDELCQLKGVLWCAIFPPMPDKIENLRREIDALDDQLAALLNRRAGLAQRIGALKSGAAGYRPEREIEILRRITKNPGVLPAERVAAVFREVISPAAAWRRRSASPTSGPRDIQRGGGPQAFRPRGRGPAVGLGR